jgi:ABC-type cobalamin/Fe3+-siderophores transport system ATPase subunit
MKTLLSAEQLTFAYGDIPALAGVNLSLAAGQVLAVLGPNGSGKSTLLKALFGHLPAAGKIQWEDRALSEWPRRQLARLIAYLPQSPTWQAGQTVGDVLRMGRAPYWGPLGLESEGDEKAVHSVASELQLSGLLHRYMDELSGGQRQTVLLGRCLVQQPRALLLDEPDTFMDLAHQMDLSRLLRRLASEQGLGILMASHDLNFAAALADRVILLKQGAIAASGTADEVMVPAVLEGVYGVAMERLERPGGRPVVVPRR